MSLRRKLCDACFIGRRKCDPTYPGCKRCQKNQKIFRFVSIFHTTQQDTVDRSVREMVSADRNICSSEQLSRQERAFRDMAFDFNLLCPSVPNLLSNLGELQPITGNTQTWQWVIEQLKSYPQAFAQYGEMTFIHKNLYRDSVPAQYGQLLVFAQYTSTWGKLIRRCCFRL
jgi:hypothetical protein